MKERRNTKGNPVSTSKAGRQNQKPEILPVKRGAKIKVLLVDDHKIIRDGIKAILNSVRTVQIVGECEDGSEVPEWLSKNETDIIMMDISMKKWSGIETVEAIIQPYPDVKVIMLSMHNEESYIVKALKAGAKGYLLKYASGEELTEAITRVYAGETYLTGEVTDIMVSKYMKSNGAAVRTAAHKPLLAQALTDREIEVLRLIAEEQTNNEIADNLFISPRTVATHRRSLLAKVGAKNTAGLVRWAMENPDVLLKG